MVMEGAFRPKSFALAWLASFSPIRPLAVMPRGNIISYCHVAETLSRPTSRAQGPLLLSCLRCVTPLGGGMEWQKYFFPPEKAAKTRQGHRKEVFPSLILGRCCSCQCRPLAKNGEPILPCGPREEG